MCEDQKLDPTAKQHMGGRISTLAPGYTGSSEDYQRGIEPNFSLCREDDIKKRLQARRNQLETELNKVVIALNAMAANPGVAETVAALRQVGVI